MYTSSAQRLRRVSHPSSLTYTLARAKGCSGRDLAVLEHRSIANFSFLTVLEHRGELVLETAHRRCVRAAGQYRREWGRERAVVTPPGTFLRSCRTSDAGGLRHCARMDSGICSSLDWHDAAKQKLVTNLAASCTFVLTAFILLFWTPT